MSDYSYSINNPAFAEMSFNGVDAEIVTQEIHFIDDKPFLSGTISTNYGDNVREFVAPIEADDLPSLTGLKQRELQAVFSEDRLNGLLETYSDRIVASNGEAFDNMSEAMRQARADLTPSVTPDIDVETAAAADTPAAPETPDGRLSNPVLGEFEINGQQGDLVIHEVTPRNGMSFVSGTWSVETATGFETREFAVAVDPDSIPSDITPENMGDILQTAKHDVVLSRGEGFADQGRLMRDIETLLPLSDDPGHVPLLAQMGQEYEGFVPGVRNYVMDHDPNQAIKMALLDEVGIDVRGDLDLRDSLLHGTGDLEEFQSKLNSHLDLDQRQVRGILGEIADRAGALSRKTGPLVGAGIAAVAATAAGASEYQDGATLGEAALVGGEVFHESANPYAETTTLLLQAEFTSAAGAAEHESYILGAELAGAAVGIKVGATLGSAFGPWGATAGGFVGGVGGAIVGAEAMERMLESEPNPPQVMFVTYFDAMLPVDEMPEGMPPEMAELAALKEQILQAEQNLLDAQREFPPDPLKVMEAERALDGTDAQAGLYEQYENIFMNMDIGEVQAHITFLEEQSATELADSGLDGNFTVGNVVMGIEGVLNRPAALQALRDTLEAAHNDDALAALDRAVQIERLDDAWSEVKAAQPDAAPAPDQPAVTAAAGQQTIVQKDTNPTELTPG